MDYKNYLIQDNSSIKNALMKLNSFTMNDGLTLFVMNEINQLKGTLTDGDIRRGLLNGLSLDDTVDGIMNRCFKYLNNTPFLPKQINEIRINGIHLIPLLNENGNILKIINLEKKKTLLPVDAVIMAGGKGERLRPLTLDVPKPLLQIGEKPIIEHMIDRLANYGVDNITISIKYLGQQIIDYLGNGSNKNLKISYVEETLPLGTMGAVSMIDDFSYDNILIMNSDLLTNIDFESFYNDFIDSGADMSIATIPYEVQIPYAVLETDLNNIVYSLREKPSYTYYSNGGIYLIKKECLRFIPKNKHFNATDLIEILISNEKKVISSKILGYWLDIGRHSDYLKAKEDIKHLNH